MHGVRASTVRRRPIPHPLLGTSIGTLLRSFSAYGWPDATYSLHLAGLLGASVLRTPFYHMERLLIADQMAAQELAAPPVFIIGHWRSGTTHLHHLLSRDPQFAYVTLMQAAFPLDFITTILGPLFAALLPPRRPMDAVPVGIESPMEEEMAMAAFGSFSFYHNFFFPREGRRAYRESVHFEGLPPERVEKWWRDYRYFLLKVQSTQPGRRLLLKNPANSGRVAALRREYPGAKFICLHRHPEKVYASAMHLHRKLREAWSLQKGEQQELRETVLLNYVDLMDALLDQTAGMPPSELIEVALARLETDPLAMLRTIYDQLGLHGFDDVAPRFRDYLDAQGVYAPNCFDLSPDERAAVRSALPHVYARWGYD